ncbi:MAG: hypothetical protein Cons2KO_10330 [Congregibacter sp.]
MGISGIFAAILVLAALGTTFVYWITRDDKVESFVIIVGYGLLCGLLGIPLLTRLVDVIGFPASFPVVASVAALLSCVFFVLGRRRAGASHAGMVGGDVPAEPQWDRLAIIAVALLVALLAYRVYLLACEVVWNPLYPWDATMHWATKTKVWFEHLELRPFLENADWLTANSNEVYTDHHPGYPITIPLLQLYMSSALGSWNDSLMNLPWVVCMLGLGAAFYSQARRVGAGPVLAMIFTYFLLSMPLLNTHVALAGYADLFLGACYCLALMALHSWSIDRQRSQALLAGFFALSCLLVKNEGLFWALTLIPGVIVVLIPGKKAPLALVTMLLLALLALFFFPQDVQVAGHSLSELRIFFRAAALEGTFDSIFVYDNWHLFGYVLVGLLLVSGMCNRGVFRDTAGVSMSLSAALVLFLFLFLFTKYSGGAIRLTAVARISLQLIPAFMFYSLLLTHSLLRR